jgi:serine/threonine-protein kinase
MAPEQLMGLPADGRADLWAAGVILYEMLTGRGPFVAETPAAVMHNVMQAEPALPSSIVPTVPPVFDAVVARAMAKKPENRFQSARDFAIALVAAFKGKSIADAVKPASSSVESTLSPEQAHRYDKTGTIGTKTMLGTMQIVLPPETLAEIEASLTKVIGPLARHLVRKGATQARSVEEFYQVLAENIPEGIERTDFLIRIARLEKGSIAPVPPATKPPERSAAKPVVIFDPTTLAAAEKRLAQYVGPLARVLIKRAANDSGDVKELYRKLAEHIDSEPERKAFLDGLR